jgi:hypothetical protein
VLSEDEAKFLFEKGCDQVVIGSGQMGNDGSSSLFRKKGLRGLVRTDARGDPDVQPVARKENRALSCDLLKKTPW